MNLHINGCHCDCGIVVASTFVAEFRFCCDKVPVCVLVTKAAVYIPIRFGISSHSIVMATIAITYIRGTAYKYGRSPRERVRVCSANMKTNGLSAGEATRLILRCFGGQRCEVGQGQ